jgi:hypothetical protein
MVCLGNWRALKLMGCCTALCCYQEWYPIYHACMFCTYQGWTNLIWIYILSVAKYSNQIYFVLGIYVLMNKKFKHFTVVSVWCVCMCVWCVCMCVWCVCACECVVWVHECVVCVCMCVWCVCVVCVHVSVWCVCVCAHLCVCVCVCVCRKIFICIKDILKWCGWMLSFLYQKHHDKGMKSNEKLKIFGSLLKWKSHIKIPYSPLKVHLKLTW